MASGKRDDNNVVVVMGEDPDGNPAPVKVDNATGYLLMAVTEVSNVTPADVPDKAEHDPNNVPSMICEDDNSETILTAMVDNRNGNLWVSQS